MPDYKYRGTNRSGDSVSGVMTAGSKAELQNILRRQQITPTKMSEKGREFNIPSFGGGVDSKELAIFTRQFSVMIDAGLPLVQCLEILAGQQENKTFQKVLTGTRSAVEGGATLSAAMRSVLATRLRPLTQTWRITLLPLTSRLGASISQEAKWFSLGKAVKSGPNSE